MTEIFIDLQGINYDDLLIARTCPRCGRLLYGGDVADLRDRDSHRVIVRTPDARMYVLRGSELLTVHCGCGSFCAIVIYGPAWHEGAGFSAYTVVELNGLSQALTGRLRQMRALGDTPADVEEWVGDETVRGVTRAVRLTARQAFSRVSEDWSGSRYSSGWVTL